MLMKTLFEILFTISWSIQIQTHHSHILWYSNSSPHIGLRLKVKPNSEGHSCTFILPSHFKCASFSTISVAPLGAPTFRVLGKFGSLRKKSSCIINTNVPLNATEAIDCEFPDYCHLKTKTKHEQDVNTNLSYN